METARFLGMEPVREKPVKTPITMAKDMSKNLFHKIESKSHIIIEDYELTLPNGLVIVDKEKTIRIGNYILLIRRFFT